MVKRTLDNRMAADQFVLEFSQILDQVLPATSAHQSLFWDTVIIRSCHPQQQVFELNLATPGVPHDPSRLHQYHYLPVCL